MKNRVFTDVVSAGHGPRLLGANLVWTGWWQRSCSRTELWPSPDVRRFAPHWAVARSEHGRVCRLTACRKPLCRIPSAGGLSSQQGQLWNPGSPCTQVHWEASGSFWSVTERIAFLPLSTVQSLSVLISCELHNNEKCIHNRHKLEMEVPPPLFLIFE